MACGAGMVAWTCTATRGAGRRHATQNFAQRAAPRCAVAAPLRTGALARECSLTCQSGAVGTNAVGRRGPCLPGAVSRLSRRACGTVVVWRLAPSLADMQAGTSESPSAASPRVCAGVCGLHTAFRCVSAEYVHSECSGLERTHGENCLRWCGPEPS